MHTTFLCKQETSAHLHANCAQHKCRCHPSAVADAACRQYRDIHRICHLGNQGHGGKLADMTAGFATFGNDSICTCSRHHLCRCDRSRYRNHLDACFLPHGNILIGNACTCGDYRHLFLRNDFCHFLHMGTHQHDIHAEGFICQASCNANLFSQIIAACVHCRDNPKAAIGNRCRQLAVSNPCHTALKNRIFDAQHLTNR